MIEGLETAFRAKLAVYVEGAYRTTVEVMGMREANARAVLERLAKAPHEVKLLKLLDRTDNLREMSVKDEGFTKLYIRESRDLLIAVGDADLGLGRELQAVIDELGREIL